jgi:hypothetical protein
VLYVTIVTYTPKMETSVCRGFGGVLPGKIRLTHKTAIHVFYLVTVTSSDILRDGNYLREN